MIDVSGGDEDDDIGGVAANQLCPEVVGGPLHVCQASNQMSDEGPPATSIKHLTNTNSGMQIKIKHLTNTNS